MTLGYVMLTCPHCGFENPDQNRFCQQCGSALQLWQALIVPQPLVGLEAGSTEPPEAVDLSEAAALTLAALFPAYPYLDPQQRYQVLAASPTGSAEPVSASTSAAAPIALSVIDCQPAVASPLLALRNHWLALPPAELEQALSEFAWPADLPAAAQPYLVLQSQFLTTVPFLHDAWQGGRCAVLLIEDRSDWSRLQDMWKLGEVAPLQQLHWFYRMAELWDALARWQAQSSLLDPQNLCVDEDQVFCLGRLQPDPAAAPALTQLGLLWQSLTAPAQDSLPVEIQALIDQLAAGKIDAIAALHRQLNALADRFQQTVLPAPEPAAADLSEPPLPGVPPTRPPLPADFEPAALDLAVATAARDLPDDFEPGEQSLNPMNLNGPDIDDFSDDSTVEAPDLEADADTEPGPMAADAIAPPPVIEASVLELPEDVLGSEDTAPAELVEDAEENLDLPTMVLPMKIVRLDEAGLTHVGRQRDHNEDFFFAQSDLTKLEGPLGSTLNVKGLYVLCDGMGGHASGEVASSLAVKTLQTYFADNPINNLPDDVALSEAVAAANQAIYEINQQDDRSGHSRMGTTLVLLLIQNDRVAVAHVGDSRLYSYTRRHGLKQVTVDHEVGQREIQRGVEPAIAYARPDAYQLTQALGPRSCSDLRPGISFLNVAEDTLFILCSDGLSDNDLLEQHCATHIEPLLKSQSDLEEGVKRLIQLANEHNGHDNITAVLVRLKLRPNMDRALLG